MVVPKDSRLYVSRTGIVAGYGLMKLLDRFHVSRKPVHKTITALLLIVVMGLASSSYLFTVFHYAKEDLRGITSNTVDAINWVYHNADFDLQ